MRRRLEVEADWRSEALPIHLRAYVRPIEKDDKRKGHGPDKSRVAKVGPNDVVLVFDTETTTDPPQRLRVLFYQLRVGGRLDEEAAAYDPSALSARELATLHAYCGERGLPAPMTIEAFRRDVFLVRGYDCGAEIVGFNLPFDLARIAIDASPARAGGIRRKMRGGHSLKIVEESWRPKVQVKHLSRSAALCEFTAERRQRTSRPERKRREHTPVHRGHFTDVHTLAAALTSRSHSLKSLTKALATPTQKVEIEQHGGPLTYDYLDYARSDVQATWECFRALVVKAHRYGVGGAHWDILSEASLGKAVLGAMGVQPWLARNPDPSPQLLAKILSSYFGGRTEVRWRKTVRQVFHTDFTSMYPTVCTLMGLWRFIIATGFETRDATDEARSLLASVSAAQLQDPSYWPQLTMLVKVLPNRDFFPTRADFGGGKNATIGLNRFSMRDPVWVTLADCIVATILGGKPPEVLEATSFEPGPPQPGLKPIHLFGQHRIDPRTDDLFRKVIQLRIAEKVRAEGLEGLERETSDDFSQSLKIMANSTSYGIFIQVNVETESKPIPVEVFTPDGGSFVTRSRKVERPGPYFHPLLATLITGAARLMLALAEHRAGEEGLDWVFCDTDSLALCRPDGLPEEAFLAAADRVLAWFLPLDPYGVGRSILKAEPANFSLEDGSRLAPLYCLAISSKRYVLFNLDANGAPVIRKGSAHGLGHLLPPYREPADSEVEDDDLPLWQRDLWHEIVGKALQGQLHSMRYDYRSELRRPAVSRYAATSPELVRWFSHWNRDKKYPDQVKPFGFLHALHAKRNTHGLRLAGVHPIAPFDRTPERAVRKAFDRVTGAPIPANALQTYAEALAGYHLSPESKFRNGEAFDVGRTERRHIHATGVEWIGKEADRFEEEFFVRTGVDLAIRYGDGPGLKGSMLEEVAQAAKMYGDSAVSGATGVSRAAIARVRLGQTVVTRTPLTKVRRGLDALTTAARARDREERSEIFQLRQIVSEHGGLRSAARALGVDFGNLGRRLRRAADRGDEPV